MDLYLSYKSVQYGQAKYISTGINFKRKYEKKPMRFAFSKICRTWSFHVDVLKRAAKKRTGIQNVREEPFCSLKLLFGDPVVAIAVIVC